MYLPNELLNIIFSFVERPKFASILNEIIKNYTIFISLKQSSNLPTSYTSFPIYFFRLFYPIWKRWPENYPFLNKLSIN